LAILFLLYCKNTLLFIYFKTIDKNQITSVTREIERSDQKHIWSTLSLRLPFCLNDFDAGECRAPNAEFLMPPNTSVTYTGDASAVYPAVYSRVLRNAFKSSSSRTHACTLRKASFFGITEGWIAEDSGGYPP